MKKLSVIIPCYKQDPAQAINSILNQVGNNVNESANESANDIEIILSLDGDDTIYDSSKNCKVTSGENAGAGVARQRALDIAEGEYITFLDADDIWYNLLTYNIFCRDILSGNNGVVDIAKFGILEQMSTGDFHIINNDSTWCFGKFYRKAFLDENNIRFHPELRVHEDSYFIRLAELCNPNIVQHGDCIYLWHDNPDSTVRKNNGEYWQTGFKDYIKTLFLIRDERIRRGMPYNGTYDLAYCYTTISKMDRVHAEECIEYIRGTVWMHNPDELYGALRAAENQQNAMPIIPKMSFEKFIDAIRA